MPLGSEVLTDGETNRNFKRSSWAQATKNEYGGFKSPYNLCVQYCEYHNGLLLDHEFCEFDMIIDFIPQRKEMIVFTIHGVGVSMIVEPTQSLIFFTNDGVGANMIMEPTKTIFLFINHSVDASMIMQPTQALFIFTNDGVW